MPGKIMGRQKRTMSSRYITKLRPSRSGRVTKRPHTEVGSSITA